MDEMKKWLRGQVENNKIPDAVTPGQMEKKLEQAEQKKGGFFLPKAGILVAAALLMAVLGMWGGLWLQSDRGQISQTEVAEASTEPVFADAKAFQSDVTYEELYNMVKEYYSSAMNGDRMVKYKVAKEYATESLEDGAEYQSNAATGESTTSTFGEDFSKTDLQVAGVDEGDRILTDGAYFYTIQSREDGTGVILHILKVDGKNTKEVSKMEFSGFTYSNMYLHQKKLFLIGVKEKEVKEKKKKNYAVLDLAYRRSVTTTLYVLDISEKEHPKKEYTLTQDGFYKNSRLTDGYFYLFSVYDVPYLRKNDLKKEKPETYVPHVNGEVISEERIYAPSKYADASYTVMTSLALENPSEFTDKAAVYGMAQQFYMSQKHFYLTQKNYMRQRYFPYILEKNVTEDAETASGDALKQNDAKEDERDKTILLKYAYQDGTFSMQAKGKFTGEVDGSYAFHEHQGNLSVIYTKYDEKTTNGLYIFDASLNKIGEIGDLGVDEEIYASYYIDHMAYFVTYRNTDPVFAVDISDAKKPRLCSELKLPGYSDYLHSFGENYMVGLGFHGDGKNSLEDRVKISLFYIDDKKSLTEVAKEVTSYKSEKFELIDWDHRQVFVDEERGLFGFYVWKYGEAEEYRYVLYQKKREKLKKLWEAKEVYKNKWAAEDSLRGIRVGETFYVVTDSGKVKTFLLQK